MNILINIRINQGRMIMWWIDKDGHRHEMRLLVERKRMRMTGENSLIVD